jgi:hypothetical protein
MMDEFDPKPLDGASEDELLVAAMLLGFEWKDDDDLLCYQWYACEGCEACTYSMSCWGIHYPCDREHAVRRFLYNRGLVSKIQEHPCSSNL